MRKTIPCYVARPTAIRFAAQMSILHPARSSLERWEFAEEERSQPARRRVLGRTRKLRKRAPNRPSLRANQDRLGESDWREFLRELFPPEMCPDSLRPD